MDEVQRRWMAENENEIKNTKMVDEGNISYLYFQISNGMIGSLGQND